MKRTNKRHKLIQVGKEIVAQQGFKAASLNEILTAAEVPKGSFYYYFPSKDDFGLAIIDDFAGKYQLRLQNLLENQNIPHLQRLRSYFEAGISDMQACECSEGCLMGNLAQELSAQNELFRDRLCQIFLDWEKAFAQCLKSAIEAGELPQDQNELSLARFILAGWQGAILQAKVSKSILPMKTFVQFLFSNLLTN